MALADHLASATEGAERLDLARLLPPPLVPPYRERPRPATSIDWVLDHIMDSDTADAVEALAEALPRPKRHRRRRRVRIENKLLAFGVAAALAFAVLAVRWEMRQPPREHDGE